MFIGASEQVGELRSTDDSNILNFNSVRRNGASCLPDNEPKAKKKTETRKR
jgi:hypothetical protein